MPSFFFCKIQLILVLFHRVAVFKYFDIVYLLVFSNFLFFIFFSHRFLSLGVGDGKEWWLGMGKSHFAFVSVT